MQICNDMNVERMQIKSIAHRFRKNDLLFNIFIDVDLIVSRGNILFVNIVYN
jgi:hypothetical protein